MADASVVRRHHRIKDLRGQRFGKLVALEQTYRGRYVLWRCLCDCGRETVAHGGNLLRGKTRSCGSDACKGLRRHGCTPRLLYGVWAGMLDRCRNPKRENYHERGIRVSALWRTYEPFRDWALAHGWRPGLQIDRENNYGNYTTANSRFVTAKVNSNNTRRNRVLTWDGRSLTVAQWAEELGVPYHAVWNRAKAGWPVERIFTQPFRALARRGPR